MSDVRIEGNNIKRILQMVEEQGLVALDAVGMQASSVAKRELQNTPSRIDTGLLRNSITWAVSGKPPAIGAYAADRPSQHGKRGKESGAYSGTAPDDDPKTPGVYVGTNVEYAIYVHEGTERMAPNRFLKNALSNNKEMYGRIIAKILRSASI